MSIPYIKPKDWQNGFAGQDFRVPANRHYRRSIQYYAALYQAWPRWATTDPRLRDIYKEAEKRRIAGEDVQVDHIVPITSTLVCGLHVFENLEIIATNVNLSKSNKYWPDHPYETRELFK